MISELCLVFLLSLAPAVGPESAGPESPDTESVDTKSVDTESEVGLKGAHLRVARPTDHLEEVVKFYRDGLGFEILGKFEDHAGFDGVMLGHPEMGYHLEFTHQQDHAAGKAPTKDNLLIFYFSDETVWKAACDRMQEHGYPAVEPWNPYWEGKSSTFEDVDGYRVVLANFAWR